VIQPELVVPIVVFLASRTCEFTHQNYSACAGRFSRVLRGPRRGLAGRAGAATRQPTTSRHICPTVSATEPFTVPGSIFEEVFAVCERLGVTVFSE